jgi:acetyl esterase
MTSPESTTGIPVAGPAVENRSIDGPHGPLRLRIYFPPADRTASVGLVWVHGGAFAFGDIDMPEAHWVAQQLAESGITVVSVDYQLAPQFDPADLSASTAPGVRFPVASEEVSAAFEWAVAAADELGVPAAAWSLGGASAGGNLSAGAALRQRDRGGLQPQSLLLVYPVVHKELPPHRPELAAKVAALPAHARFEPAAVRFMNLNYVENEALLDDPFAFAGGSDLGSLPPTFILNSDADSLRSSAELFASELALHAVHVLLVREDGTRHGHLNEPADPGAHRSIRRMAAWLTSPLLWSPSDDSASTESLSS